MQRVLKFTKYLARFGWEPVVLTVGNGAYPVIDETLARQIPPETKVRRVSSWDPFAYYARFVGKEKGASTSFSSEKEVDWRESLSRSIRGNLFIPDARRAWVKPAIKAGLDLVNREGIEAIISSGPPHSTHLIARGIKRKTGIAWIADFRDLWTEIDYKDQMPQSKLAAWFDANYERSVLLEADMVSTVSPSCKTSLESIEDSIDCKVIANGFDPDDYSSFGKPAPSDRFTLTYAGTLGPTRNPSSLWRAISHMRSKGFLKHLQLRFFGSVDASVRREILRNSLDDICDFAGAVSHSNVLQEMLESNLLLLLINRVSEKTMAGITPGKMFEYMASGVPILGLGSSEGDAAKILLETDSGEMLDYDDQEGLESVLARLYRTWEEERQTEVKGLRISDEVLKKYNRIEQSRMMAEYLDFIAKGKV